MGKTTTTSRITARIPPAVEARVIELSIQHPEFGAKRLLPLLKKETIAVSASSIYNILKRHGLQNREKRFAMIQAQHRLEAPPLTGADNPPPAERIDISPGFARSKTQTRTTDRRSVPRMAAQKFPVHKVQPAFEKPAKNKIRIPLALKLVSISLLAVLAFSGYQAALKVHRARPAPQPKAAAVPAPAPDRAKDEVGEIAPVTTPAADSNIRKRDLPDTGDLLEAYTDWQPPPNVSWLPPYISRVAWPAESPWSFSLGIEEVDAWLADARRLWQDATLDPYLKDNLPAGFTITDMQPGAIYGKMGLQNGDVIQGVNGEPITGPEQALYFFQRVAEGGVVEIKIRRRRRSRYISLTLQ